MCFTTVCLSSSIRATFKDGCAGRWGGSKMCSSKAHFDIPHVTSGYASNRTLHLPDSSFVLSNMTNHLQVVSLSN